MIQESQSMKNNGGGGNTGYYQRGRKKKEKAIDVFSEAEEKDSFTPEISETEEPKGEKFLDKILEKTKDIVKKVQNESDEKKVKNNPFQQMSESENE